MSRCFERTYFRSWIVVPLLLVILSYLTDFTFFALAQMPDVHILDFLYTIKDSTALDVAFYKHGFNASLSSRNFTLAGRKVHIIPMAPPLDKVASTIEQAVGTREDLFVVIGPGSTKLTKAALPALRNKSVVAFGPVTRKPSMRIWDEHLYYFLPSTGVSAYTFLSHAVIRMRALRIGVMYTTNSNFGYDAYKFLTRLMKGMGLNFCGVFSIDAEVQDTPDGKELNKRWEMFATARPQVVIVLGLKNSGTKLFIQKVLRDPRTSSTDLMLTYVEGVILDLWRKAIADGTSNFNGRMFTASSVPDSSDMVKKFRIDIDKYFQKRVDKGYDKAKGKPGGWVDGSATLAGWVAGEILFQALAGFNPPLNRTQFISSLFNQRSYVIEDFVVGNFADDVSDAFKKSGADARCNEGATAAYLRQFSHPSISTSVPEGDYVFSIHTCHEGDMTMSDSSAIVTVNFTNLRPDERKMITEVTTGQNAGFLFKDSEPRHDVSLKIIQASREEAGRIVREEWKDYQTKVATGMAVDDILDIPNLTFIDPIYLKAGLNKFRRDVVILSPTVAQQLFVIAEYIASLPDRTIHALLRSMSANEALDMLKKSLLTFDVTLSSSTMMRRGDNVENHLATSGVTVMIEVDESDVPLLVAHLERHKKARLIVLSNPIIFFYDVFYAAFNGTQAADRLLFLTNLPHWADRNSKSKMISNYHERVDPLLWSPATLQSFIVGRFIREVVDDLRVVTWSSVADDFYSSVVVRLDDMTFGPYADSKSVTCTSTSDPDSLDCAQNFGATSISIWPMSRVYDPNVGVLFGPVTPSLKYRVSKGLTRSQLIGVIVGSFVGVAVLAAVLWLLFFYFCTDNFYAPKDPEGPVTLIFTDIQSSTALWAACPDIMHDAVERHHRLIRRLIAKYKCYEVKTVGDSFMIACKSPYAAVKLVGDLQRTFLEYDWGTSAIDEAYHEFEETQAEEDAHYKPPTARLDDAVYREHWNGLRVRAGVHTGLSDIRYDEVTNRYDYYGSTSNTTARTESIANGGQVLLTRAAYMALSTAERAELNVTALGAVELRGVPEPVEMLQLNPVPGRTFAKLRLERANDDFDFDTSTFTGTETSDSLSESLSPTAENVFAVLQDTFASFPPQQRLKALEPLCKRWNVTVPVLKNAKDLLAVIRVAEQRLAMKITRILERRQLVHDHLTATSETVSSARGSLFLHKVSTINSLRDNWSLKAVASKLSQGSERQGILHPMSFSVNRGSPVTSSTAWIHVKEPSFLDIEWV